MNKTVRFISISFIIIVLLCLPGCEKKNGALPVDADGNEYHTINIGTQVWLKENLKTTKNTGGASISLVTDNKNWETCSWAAYCFYNNDEGLKDTYGLLYNYKTVKAGVLCPVGYHLPTREDWTTLINYLGGKYEAGIKLKEKGTAHWKWFDASAVGTDETGFTALPGGVRYWNGSFDAINFNAEWWISDGGTISLGYQSGFVKIGALGEKAGLSVRCVKNN